MQLNLDDRELIEMKIKHALTTNDIPWGTELLNQCTEYVYSTLVELAQQQKEQRRMKALENIAELIEETVGVFCPQCISKNTTYKPNSDELEITCLDCGFVFDIDEYEKSKNDNEDYHEWPISTG